MNCGPAPTCWHKWLDATSFIDMAKSECVKLCSRCGEVVRYGCQLSLDVRSRLVPGVILGPVSDEEIELPRGVMPWDAPKCG